MNLSDYIQDLEAILNGDRWWIRENLRDYVKKLKDIRDKKRADATGV